MPEAPRLLLATRSEHKLREIRQILAAGAPVELVSLADLGEVEREEEAGIERFETFRENAAAKARYFFQRTGLPTLADDSGLRVDALDGEPGVRTKRFAGRNDLEGQALDDANLDHLLERLKGVPQQRRGARYVCATALVRDDDLAITTVGTCPGRILTERRGRGGFGYDPVFHLPALDATFAEVDAHVKHRLSHRGRAFRAVTAQLGAALASPGTGW